MDEIDQDKPSKSQLKRDAQKLQDLGHSLVKLPISVLRNFKLPTDLFDAIKFAQSIRQNGALKRQIQFIGKLMRQYETNKIQKMHDNYFLKLKQINNDFHIYENWRDKFLENDKTVFSDFITQYPNVDRQQLRQLQRHAINEQKQQKPPKYARLLFTYIKENITSTKQQENLNQINTDLNEEQ